MAEEKTSTEKKDYVELRIPKGITYLLILGIVLLAFFAGSLWSQLQKSFAPVMPKTVAEAFSLYAKQINLDPNKFTACFNENRYANRVREQAQEGEALGIRATPSFFVNGKRLGGAFPYAAFKDVIDRELAGTGSEDYTIYNEILRTAYEDPQGKGFDPVPKTVAIGDAPFKGPANAKVTIVEFSDYQCPFCQRVEPTVKQILSEYKDVKVVFKHYPITSIHPNAQKAAEAAECAREQGKFWEYTDLLFTNQSAWSEL